MSNQLTDATPKVDVSLLFYGGLSNGAMVKG